MQSCPPCGHPRHSKASIRRCSTPDRDIGKVPRKPSARRGNVIERVVVVSNHAGQADYTKYQPSSIRMATEFYDFANTHLPLITRDLVSADDQMQSAAAALNSPSNRQTSRFERVKPEAALRVTQVVSGGRFSHSVSTPLPCRR